jgi:cytidylate kinase
MDNIIISIGRELGSGGKEIAERLATRLGMKFYDKKLLEIAAHESGLDTTVFENADERESHAFIGNMFSIHGSIADILSGSSCMDTDQLFAIQSEAIRNIAEKESCIIVGRCAEYVLRDHPRMTSIFITANHEDRIKYIMKNDMVDREHAIETISKGDKRRRHYHDYYTTSKWGEARNYDLCINSSHMGIEGTTEFLYDYIKKRFKL